MKGYKGFNKDMKCRGMQFEVGKTYEYEGDIKLCEKGFHFCENPLDIFNYYSPAGSRFAEIEAGGVSNETENDSKRCSKKLTVKGLVSLQAMVKRSVEFIFSRVDWKNAEENNTGDQSAATNTGYYSAATNTGDYSAATNTGDRSAATNTGHRSAATNTGDDSAATNTGDRSAASVEGKESVAISVGRGSKAKASLSSFIVLAEWKEGHRVSVKSVQVDGKKIKADTFYTLKRGKFVKAD